MNRMGSKRWLNAIVLITLIHVGVISFLWQQGLIQPPHWVDTQIVASAPEAQGAATAVSPIDTSMMPPPSVNTLAAVPIPKNNQAAVLRADHGVKAEPSSVPMAVPSTQSVTEHPTVSRPNSNAAASSGSAVGGSSISGASGVFANNAANRVAMGKASAGATNSAAELTEPTHIGGHLRNPKPPYPDFSRDAGEQGVVTLSVMVEPNGRASSVDVVKGSGYSRLDRSAHDTVLNQYRFIPATRGGQPIAYRYRFSIVFNLNKAS